MIYDIFMKKALVSAKKALSEGEFPVGSIIVYDDKKIIATGRRKNSKKNLTNEIDHAEIIALKNLAQIKNNIDTNKLTIYTTLEPCLMCFAAIILAKINKIVYAYEDIMGGGTKCNFDNLPFLYQKKITVVPHILRSKSHELFKEYFLNHNNNYLANTVLENYTINLSI